MFAGSKMKDTGPAKMGKKKLHKMQLMNVLKIFIL